jgi:hypothetical protein
MSAGDEEESLGVRTKLVPPGLKSPVTSEAWFAFKADYASYKDRGGKKPMRALIHQTALPILRIRIPAVEWSTVSDEDLSASLTKLYGAKSKAEGRSLLKTVHFPDWKAGELQGAAEAFASEFAVSRDNVHFDIRQSEEAVVELFISKIRPSGFKDEVESEEPETFEEAVMSFFNVLDVWVKIDRQTKRAKEDFKKPSGGVKPVRKSSREPESKQHGGENPEAIVCFGCKRPGHKKPDCKHVNEWENERARDRELKRRASTKTPLVAVMAEEHPALPSVQVSFGNQKSSLKHQVFLDTCASVNVVHPDVVPKLVASGAWVRPHEGSVKIADGSPLVYTQMVKTTMVVQYQGKALLLPFDAVVAATPLKIIASWPWISSNNLNFDSLRNAKPTVWAEDNSKHESVRAEHANEFHQDPKLMEDIDELLSKFPRVFDENIVISNPKLPVFRIELNKDADISSLHAHKPRRISPKLQPSLDESIENDRAMGIIQSSSAPFAAPVVIVAKKDGGARVCVDYRELNALTRKLAFPLPNADEILQRMAGKTHFAALDLRQAYNQMPIHSDDQYLTSFVTRQGLFCNTQVPFGLMNGGPHTQRVLANTVMPDLVGICCELFIDDIIVYGSSSTEFLSNLSKVLKRLEDFDLRLKKPKCHFGLSKVEYLGHIVSQEGIAMSTERRMAIQNMSPPETTKQLRSFMGFANYFRHHVQNFSIVAKPLTQLCSSKVPFRWGPSQQAAFVDLRRACSQSPLLSFLDYNKPIYLRTDASDTGAGGYLFQIHNGVHIPVAFASVAFNDVQCRWSTYEQEAFAVYFSITKFEHHLKGAHFTVETDHRNLKFISSSTTPKVVRWRMVLAEYDFDIQHLPGDDNLVADALSRVPLRTDPIIASLTVNEPNLPTFGPGTLHDVLSRYHNAMVGHVGVNALMNRLRDAHVQIPVSDVKAYVKSCAVCQKLRLGQGPIIPSVKSTSVQEPFQHLIWDTVGPLPEDSQGHSYVLVAMDRFTRFIELVPTPSASSDDAAKALLQIVGRYGLFETIHSDRGTQFCSTIVKQMTSLLGITQSFGAPYHPESQGTVERSNRETIKHLRALVLSVAFDGHWSTALPLAQRIYNSRTNRSTGCAPAELLYGKAVSLDRGLLLKFPADSQESTYDAYIRKLKSQQNSIIHASVAHQQEVIQDYLKSAPPNPTGYALGDLVLIAPGKRPPRSKLQPRWLGPFEVATVAGDEYTLRDINSGKTRVVHASRIKIYNPDSSTDSHSAALWDSDQYAIDSIVDHKLGTTRGRSKFRVRWLDYGPSGDTWEPLKHVASSHAFATYIRDHPMDWFPVAKYPLMEET